jgi:hypothetical protein
MLCRVGLFFIPGSIDDFLSCGKSNGHVFACDKAREFMLVSYTSEPILAFGAMKQWRARGLCPLLKSIRTALIQGVVKDETLCENSAIILLLESMDELDAGLGWSAVHTFLEKIYYGGRPNQFS